ncbi:3299_t:CDS:2 [Entrophospora sp. SA101]|nr:3299_t:CDS:2 [Entrophospora sp. SA101]
MDDVDRYFHLCECEIPVQQSDPTIVARFVKTLLNMRNILIVNMSLLINSSIRRSDRDNEVISD